MASRDDEDRGGMRQHEGDRRRSEGRYRERARYGQAGQYGPQRESAPRGPYGGRGESWYGPAREQQGQYGGPEYGASPYQDDQYAHADEERRDPSRERSEWGQSWQRPVDESGENRPYDAMGQYGTQGRDQQGNWSQGGYGERQYGQSQYGQGQYGQLAGQWGPGADTGGIGWMQSGAQGPEGVRQGRFTGRGPKGYQRSNERVREEVCDRLTDHPEIDASEMDVDVQNGTVSLRGTVQDRRQKRMAEECVESVPGVRDVSNMLRVQGQTQLQSPTTGQSALAGQAPGTASSAAASGRGDTGSESTSRYDDLAGRATS